MMTEITGETSDGFHTFNELYEHRTSLFAALTKFIQFWPYRVSRSRLHRDGTMFDGMFIVVVENLDTGKQASYHIDDKFWPLFNHVMTVSLAPVFDGHTPNDVLRFLNGMEPL
jgi:hypothetical protein